MELLARVPGDLAGEAARLLIESGAEAVEEREGPAGAATLVTHFALAPGATERLRAAEAALAALGIEESALTLRHIPDADWVARSRGHFTGAPYGERLWIRPPWDAAPVPAGREEILLEPALAFGTGRHPSTRLALLAVERACAEAPPERFVDVGCGSGVLSAAALRLGAGRALALDLDPAAVEATLHLAEANGLAGRVRAENGTLERALLGDWWGRVDFLAANIYLGPLRRLAPRMAEALRPGGRGVLSGIGYEQAEELAGAAEGAGLAVGRRERFEEWTALEIEKP